MFAMETCSNLNVPELCNEIQSLAKMIADGVLGPLAALQFLFWIKTHTILLKSHILTISRLILQILVMRLSSVMYKRFLRRNFTLSYFEINILIWMKYCWLYYLSCMPWCIDSAYSIVSFQLIWLCLRLGGGALKWKFALVIIFTKVGSEYSHNE